jgi:hypothetical protein
LKLLHEDCSIYLSEDDEEEVKQKLQNLKSRFNDYMKKCSRNWTNFEAKHKIFLDGDFSFDFKLSKAPKRKIDENTTKLVKRGRPSVPFNEKSESSKFAEVAKITESAQNSPELLLSAGKLSASKLNNKTLKKSINFLSKDPDLSFKKLNEPDIQLKSFTPDEALAFLIDLNLTKAQYQKIRLQMKERGADLLPTYNLLQKSKKESVPGEILITEDEKIR